MEAPPLKVAVIGAGVSGLTTARALRRQFHQVVVYEKSNHIGGTWAYHPRVESDLLSLDPDREIVCSSLYRSLRTNLPRQLLGFPDYPFSTVENKDPRTFPGHEEVLQFLSEFAHQFRLTELIQFETEVVRVEQVELRKDLWVVESRRRNGVKMEEEMFDAVVVCNGHHTLPKLASFPGMERWPGKQMHSHNYRVADPFEDLLVVVIGDGASAKDISLEISSVAKQVHLSSRSPNIKISKLNIGNNMWQHSKIDHANENGQVVFEDGTYVYADIILHCTGYRYEFPFLKTKGIVSVEDNRVGPLYKHIFPPMLAPNLSFVGLTFRVATSFVIDLQAKWVAHVLSEKTSLLSEENMLADVHEYYQHMEMKGIPKHHTHSLCHKFEYLEWLSRQVGVSGMTSQLQSIYESFYKSAFVDGHVNREWEYPPPGQEFDGGFVR